MKLPRQGEHDQQGYNEPTVVQSYLDSKNTADFDAWMHGASPMALVLLDGRKLLLRPRAPSRVATRSQSIVSLRFLVPPEDHTIRTSFRRFVDVNTVSAPSGRKS